MPDRRRSLATLAALVLAAATLGAASAATAASATGSLRALPAPGALNYAAQPGQRLRQLEAGFVASQLGAPPVGELARLLTIGGGSRASVDPAAAAPLVNFVRSPAHTCVNGRQTADPLSAPCVASFIGDNGGATYRGVTSDEVRVLFVIAVAEDFNVTRHPPYGTYYDLALPAGQDERSGLPYLNRLRLYQAFFNKHYETWGRRVHFVVYSYGQLGADTQAACRTVAAENDALVHPFAVAVGGLGHVPLCYGRGMARRGVLTFYGDRQLETAAYRGSSGLLWGLRPDSSNAARLFSSYICQKVVGKPVVLSGNAGQNGKPRRIGMLFGDLPEYARFAAAVRQTITRCGADIVAVQSLNQPYGSCGGFFGSVGEAVNGRLVRDPVDWYQRFSGLGVTTIIWPGCADTRINGTSFVFKYKPEWVLWGDGLHDEAFEASYSSLFLGTPAFDAWTKHAVVVSPTTFQPEIRQRQCFRAMRDVDGSVPADDDTTWWSCERYYDVLRQLFNAIQLAGPVLTPATLDRGVRTVAYTGSSPQVPRCFYPQGDYSCVKDAQVDWWDESGKSQPAGGVWPGGERIGGCWRAMESGKRYPADHWPAGNIDAQLRGIDPCSYQGSYPKP